MGQDEIEPSDRPPHDPLPEADARLLAQLRGGDPEAGHRLVRHYYTGIYRYLFSLTGSRESAEDLTQETFLQAWRHLDQFQGRAPLRLWLHQIARREFLQAQRRRRPVASLEESDELSEPRSGAWTDDADLRVLLASLPEHQREVVHLYYLADYSSSEIARIVQVPERTVRYRLQAARSLLARALGTGDLAYLNEPSAPGTRGAGGRQWAWLPLEQIHALEEKSMERREFLRCAAVGAAGLILPEPENEVVDPRLAQKVTLAFKGTALSDVCDHLRAETGVQVTAGVSVADEKVTLFCRKQPLRDVMRQLARPFGYTWLRSRQELGVGSWELGKESPVRPPTPPPASRVPAQPPTPTYRYKLIQDLRSQLLEDELRNRDRNAALLALDRQMERYRPYLDLSPEEAEAHALEAGAGEKPLLENLARYGWGPIQMYFPLSPADRSALRAGQTLVFSAEPKAGEQRLPPDVARGVLQGLRGWLVGREGDMFFVSKSGKRVNERSTDRQPDAVPEVRVRVDLSIRQSELGRFVFSGGPGLFTTEPFVLRREPPRGFDVTGPDGPWAAAVAPATLQPDNATINARLAKDASLRTRVTIQPRPSCRLEPYPGSLRPPRTDYRSEATPAADPEDRTTSGDVLEAVHHATGMPIISDYYTRLHKPESLTTTDQPLFDALNRQADTMGLHWDRDKEGGWLRFRSTSFYDDRLKEVPNRLLNRWSASRRQHGSLTLEDLVEIAQLSDTQLDAQSTAEGARACFKLVEWELPRHPVLRPYLRDLAQFTPAQRQEAMSPTGLSFTRMSLAQQQLFLSRALRPTEPPLQSLDELQGAALWIDYTQPGWFEWVPGFPGPWQTWMMPVGSGPQGRRALRPRIQARTKEEVLRRIDPKLRDLMWESMRRDAPEWVPPASEAAEIYPTGLDLVFLYIPGASHQRPVRIFSAGLVSCQWTG